MSEHVQNGTPMEEWIVQSEKPSEDDLFFKKQRRIVLRNCGIIDPNSIDEYMAVGGYQAIRRSSTGIRPKRLSKSSPPRACGAEGAAASSRA